MPMSSPLSLAVELDRRLEENIATINARLRTLDEQMRLADEIIADMALDNTFNAMGDDDDFSHYSITSDDDSDDDDDVTAPYHTLDDNLFFDDEDEDDQSDCETVVGDWIDPFITPERAVRGVDIPADLEAGLEFLY